MTWFLSCNQVCLEPRINHFCNRTHFDGGTGLANSSFRSRFLFLTEVLTVLFPGY